MDPAERLTWIRKDYGDAAVLDALSAANGDVRAAHRTLNRERNRVLRASKKAHTGDQVLYSGPVEIGPLLRAIIDGARPVKTGRGGQTSTRHRATFQGTLTGLPADDYDSDGGNHIVLYDPRIGTGQATAEVVWTGSDYRIHIWKRSLLDTRPPITIEAA